MEEPKRTYQDLTMDEKIEVLSMFELSCERIIKRYNISYEALMDVVIKNEDPEAEKK
jgi:hypothetical protein